MSASETELTFIRCPSCRSLVPSVAVRCRMCGHQFEKSTAQTSEPTAPSSPPPATNGSSTLAPIKAAEPEPESKTPSTKSSGLSWQIGSRVRQRTISATPEEMEEIKREFMTSKEDTPVAPAEELTPVTTQPSFESEDRPGFIENSPEEIAEDDFEEGDFSDEDSDESESTHFGGDTGIGEGRRRRKRRRRKKKTNFEPAPNVESGSRMPAAAIEARDEIAENRIEAQREERTEERRQERREERREERRPTNFRGERPFEPRPIPERTVSERQSPERTVPERVIPEPRPVTRPVSVAVEPRVESDNMLVGWFVNFDLNPSGVSAELRSGKYFISSKKLRPGDFVIEDDTVSMPHCMVTAVPGDGLYIQDLMSEKGTYVCKAGATQFEAVTGQQKVSSGDRIRFGTHEALLVIVPKL